MPEELKKQKGTIESNDFIYLLELLPLNCQLILNFPAKNSNRRTIYTQLREKDIREKESQLSELLDIVTNEDFSSLGMCVYIYHDGDNSGGVCILKRKPEDFRYYGPDFILNGEIPFVGVINDQLVVLNNGEILVPNNEEVSDEQTRFANALMDYALRVTCKVPDEDGRMYIPNTLPFAIPSPLVEQSV